MAKNSDYLHEMLYLTADHVNAEIAKSSGSGRAADSVPALSSLDDVLGPVCEKFPDECLGFILATLDAEPYRDAFRMISPIFYMGADRSVKPRATANVSVSSRIDALKKLMKKHNLELGKHIGKDVFANGVRGVRPSYDNDLLVGKMAFRQFGLEYSPKDDVVRNLALYLLKEELCVGYDVRSAFFYPAAGRQSHVIGSAFALGAGLRSSIASVAPGISDPMEIFRAAERSSYLALAASRLPSVAQGKGTVA